ncbi:MAG: thermonuclease family protein [Aigarchaeota archaeon]|nr:thermonuclease family protein [Aigarchaeota archaeon]MCX8193120.1 thermonuclease family protein [Nitrososphaeria archaeon]MDW7986743.1 thermonuclease family protein [Nitrososphaerota archaeon]
MKYQYSLLVIFFLLISLKFAIYYVNASPFEVDVTATVYKVVDGDTFDAFPIGRVRLADINAPELDETGGKEAREALTNLVLGKKVYLDVDDRYVVDKYNRLVCIVYIREDSRRLLNVNKWLAERKLVSIVDHDNEFNPSSWNLYEEYLEELEEAVKTVTTIKTTTVFKTFTTSISKIDSDTMNLCIVGVFLIILMIIILMIIGLLTRKRR